MSTVECKDCKSMISPSAEVCPHCGAKYPASYIPSKVIIQKIKYFVVDYAMTVIIDGRVIGKLKNNDETSITLPYGVHSINVKGPFWGTFSGEMTITILPAKIYTIAISLSPGFPENHANFQVYSSDA